VPPPPSRHALTGAVRDGASQTCQSASLRLYRLNIAPLAHRKAHRKILLLNTKAGNTLPP
jgi:hypothetical protein